MTVTHFLIILTICSSATSLLTEAVKRLYDKEKFEYSTNILVLVIAVATGIFACLLYYTYNKIPMDAINITYMLFMGIANWVGATVGYDKVMQTIKQIGDVE